MQAQIQALIAGGATVGRVGEGHNTGTNMEVARPPVFNGEAEKVGGFIIAYKLYLG